MADVLRIGFNPADRFMTTVGHTLVVIQKGGDVYGGDVSNRELQPVFQYSGAKIGFNPEDRFVVTMENTIMVITKAGNVFGSVVNGRNLGPVFQYGGSKIGFGEHDKFMVAAGNLLVVITPTGSVYGAEVSGRKIGPVSQFASGAIGFNPQDRFMVAIGRKIFVITGSGGVFGADVQSHQDGIGPNPNDPKHYRYDLSAVTQYASGKIGFNPLDRFMVAMDNTLVVIKSDGNVFGADVNTSAHTVGPVFPITRELSPPPPPLPDTVSLDSGPITSGLSIGGNASLVMSRAGSYTFSGHMHDSGALAIDYLLTMVALSPDGIAFVKQQQGHTAGTFTPGSRSDDWTIAGSDNAIRDRWDQAARSRLTWTLHANDTLTPQIGSALQEALAEALKQGGQAAVKAVISLL